MNLLRYKKILPYVFFLVIILVFFYPVFLGKLPIPSDIIVGVYYPWLDYKYGYVVGVPVHNSLISDVPSLIYPIKQLAVDLIRAGEWPLWNEHIFGGYPLISNFQMGLFFPTMLFYLILSTPFAWTLQVISQVLLALIFMYLFLKNQKLSNLSSIFGAVAYAFGGFGMIWMEWNVLSLTSAFLPLILYCVDKLILNKNKKWGILLSVSLCMQILAGYPQLVAFEMFALYLWVFIKYKFEIQNLVLVLMYTFLGILLSAIQLFPAFELLSLSQRKGEVIDDNILFLPYRNLIGFFAPDYFGNPSTLNFWGYGQYTLLTIYSGLTTLLVAILSIRLIRIKVIQFFFILFIFSLIVMLNNPLSLLLHQLGIWGGPASSVTRAAFLTNFSLAALAAFGIEYYNSFSLKAIIKSILVLVIIFLVIVIGTFVYRFQLIGNLSTDLSPELYKESKNLVSNLSISQRNLILPGLILLGVTFTLILGKISRLRFNRIVPVFLLLILIFELFRFGWKFNTFASSEFLYPKTGITDYLQQYPKVRINGGDVISENMWVPYNLSSYAGYDAVYPLNSAKLISLINSGSELAAPASRYGTIGNFNSQLFDLTSSKYILALKRNEKGIVDKNGDIAINFKQQHFKKVFEDKSVVVLENTKVFPNAFFVTRSQKISDEKILMKELLRKDLDLHDLAFISDVQSNDNNTKIYSKSADPVFKRINNKYLTLETENLSESFLITTETYYPGWKAYIDGFETKIFQTDLAFRGIEIPAGKHKVEFVYQPISFYLGIFISLFTLIMLFLFDFRWIVKSMKKIKLLISKILLKP